jgi:hypothetical protein
MNKLIVSVLLSASAFAASAQTPMPDASVQVQDKSADVTVVTGTDRVADRHCLRQTGSHIVSRHKKSCVDANGTSYSREDIDRTGTTDLGDALRHLDPSVRIGHN